MGWNPFKKAVNWIGDRTGLSDVRIGGSVGQAANWAKKNVPGVGSMFGSASGIPGGSVIGSLAQGGGKQLGRDLGIGLRNTAALLPFTNAMNAKAAGQSGRAGEIMNAGGGGGGSGGGSPDSGMGWQDKILLGGTIAAGVEDNLRRRGMQDRAEKYAVGSYDSRAPLRARALEMLKADQRPDHSAMFSDPGNVYDRQKRAQLIQSVAQ